jgi:hypothetical protein
MQTLRPQRGALHDAEPVLLVDDHQPEVVESDRILDQCMRADREVDRPGRQLRLHLAPLPGRGRSGEQRHAEPRRLEEAADGDEMLLGENLSRRHERHLEAILHRDQGGHQRDDGLAGADVSLQQSIHRLRPLHVVHNFGDYLFLIAGQLERQHAACRFPDLVGDHDRPRLPLPFRLPPTQHQAELKQEELLENQALLGRRAKRVQLVDRRPGWWKVHIEQRRSAIDELLTGTHVRRQRVDHLWREFGERPVHDRALHLGCQRSGLLVNRHDAAGMQHLVVGLGCPFRVRLLFDDFVLGVLHLQAVRRELEAAEQDHALMRMEHVVEKRLVEEHRAQHAGGIADDHLEDLESRPAGRTDTAAQHLAGHRGRGCRSQRRDRLKRAAILVPGRKAIQEVFDGGEAHALKVGGPPRTDAFEVLQRRVEGDHRNWKVELET